MKDLTIEQIAACEQGIRNAINNEYVTPYSSGKEIDDNIYEILQLGCNDVDELFPEDEDILLAIDYICNNYVKL